MTFRWIRDRLIPSRSAKKPGRIFLIGHNKCGTRSFVRLLRSNGYKSIHFGNGRAARQIQANFTFSRPLLEGLDRFTGYADLEVCGEFYAYRLFPQLDLQYPGSTFVYNKRDVNAWITSRLNHSLRVKGSYADRYLNRMRAAFNNPSLDIDDLLVITEGFQVIGIFDKALGGIQLDEPVKRSNGARVVVRLIE